MRKSWVPTCPDGHPCGGQYSGAQKQLCPPGINRAQKGEMQVSRKGPMTRPLTFGPGVHIRTTWEQGTGRYLGLSRSGGGLGTCVVNQCPKND